MAKKNFLMLELEDSKTKKIANVVSNNSCRRILDYLADKESTESELAEKLDIPISTVHYNLQQLMETGLIVADEYHYSEKGKEVNHYKLANKYIIITPKKVTGITQKLKSILPVALISAGVAGIIQFYTMFTQKTAVFGGELMSAAKSTGAERAAEMLPSAADEAVEMTAQNVPAAGIEEGAVMLAESAPLWQNLALWFLIGALFALGVYFLISFIRKRN
jgi:predicted transcriptional regulator